MSWSLVILYRPAVFGKCFFGLLLIVLYVVALHLMILVEAQEVRKIMFVCSISLCKPVLPNRIEFGMRANVTLCLCLTIVQV